MKMRIAVACRNASGIPDMPIYTVSVTEAEYEAGVHYDKAQEMAEDDDYDQPFLCYDPSEQSALAVAVQELGLAVPVQSADVGTGQNSAPS